MGVHVYMRKYVPGRIRGGVHQTIKIKSFFQVHVVSLMHISLYPSTFSLFFLSSTFSTLFSLVKNITFSLITSLEIAFVCVCMCVCVCLGYTKLCSRLTSNSVLKDCF